MISQLSLNEKRVQDLNRMRGGYYHAEQRMKGNSTFNAPKASQNDDRWNSNDDLNNNTSLNDVKDAMYASTNDVVWLAF